VAKSRLRREVVLCFPAQECRSSLSQEMPGYPARPPTLAPEAYENVRRCRFTPYRQKTAYLRAVRLCGTSLSDARAEHERQRHGELRRGPRPAQLMPTEGLGVLMSRTVFARKTAARFSMSATQFKRHMDAWLNYERKRATHNVPTDTERLSADGFLRSRIPARQDGEVWLFRNPDRNDDAFSGLLDIWLGHRLGLRLRSGESRLTFSFQANLVENVAEPRFLDTTWDYLPLWTWEGRTRPLTGAPAGLHGLEEVVADPPELRFLNRPVVELISP
jgi:hypothetical protein